MFTFTSSTNSVKIGQRDGEFVAFVTREGSVSEVSSPDLMKVFKDVAGATSPAFAMIAFRKYTAQMLYEIKAMSIARRSFIAKAKPMYKQIKMKRAAEKASKKPKAKKTAK